jgi:hypothetical protein
MTKQFYKNTTQIKQLNSEAERERERERVNAPRRILILINPIKDTVFNSVFNFKKLALLTIF